MHGEKVNAVIPVKDAEADEILDYGYKEGNNQENICWTFQRLLEKLEWRQLI